MSAPAGPETGSRARVERVASLVALLVAAPLAWATIRLSLNKYYSIDELMHAHAAWLTGRGAVPYRDFFDFHFPLLYQLFGLLWRLMDDDPGNVFFVRLAVLPFVLLIVVGVALANRRRGLVAALSGPALLLSIAPFAARATEVRHDTLAFALFLSGICVLLLSGLSPSSRGALAGVLLGLAVWSSQKVLMYGAPVGLMLLVDLWRRRRGEPALFGSPRATLAGGGAVALLATAWLLATGSFGRFLEFCLRWAFLWQAEYPGFSWRTSLKPLEDGYVCVIGLATLGLAVTLPELGRKRRALLADVDLLLVACLGSSLLFFLLLKAPYDYNLIPFFGLAAVFGGRAVGVIADRAAALAPRAGLPAIAGASFAVALALLPAILSLSRLEAWTRLGNGLQHAVLSDIRELTAPSDPAYDNSGSYVSRPSASFFFYTDAVMRARLGKMLAERIPREIWDRGCVLFLQDARTGDLPEELRRFLGTYFKPWSGDLWLWGQSYRTDAGGHLASEFLAVRKDRYCVEPAALLSAGALSIDGKRVTTGIFALEKGRHVITYDGAAPDTDLHILWLPRSGKTWAPRPDLSPRFSRVL